MNRRTENAAERAAAEATEAARTLAARSHEARAERSEPAPEPESKTERQSDPGRVEKLLKNRPSTQAWDEIIAKREAEESAPEPKKETEKEVKAEVPAAEPAPEKTAEAPAPEAPKTVKVKIDGQELDAPATEVEEYGGVRPYQIAKALENRLKKQAEERAEEKKMFAQLLEVARGPAPQQQPKQEPQPSNDDFIKSKIDVIRFGTPEESAAAMREILQRQAPKPVDQNAMVEMVALRIANQQAVDKFKKDFPDIVGNHVLWTAAQSMDRERRAKLSGPVDWNDFYGKIGADIRSAVPARQSQPPAAVPKTADAPSQPSEKEARKASSASITSIPAASARAELPTEEKELTPEQERKAWIAEQKKARGLG